MNSGTPLQIPGYFWDAEKGRYFKLENDQHTPPGNPQHWWSSNIRMKRKRDEDAAAARAHHEARNSSRITHSRALNEPLMGGFLAREHGDNVRDLCSASFAQGLVENGTLFATLRSRIGPYVNLQAMFVQNKKNKDGMYSVFTNDANTIRKGSFGIDDKTGRYRYCANHLFTCDLGRWLVSSSSLITDIKCDATETNVFVASASMGVGHKIAFFRMVYGGLPAQVQICRDTNRIPYILPNTICVSPPGHINQCLVGTNLGLAAFHEDSLSLITPTFPGYTEDFQPSPFKDIFSVDYHAANPNVMYFGGRPGKLFIGDIRQDAYGWNSVQLRSSIAHLKAVNEHQFLVAGLNNMMAVYDIRFCNRVGFENIQNGPQKPGHHLGGNPIVTMPKYKNLSRLDTGLDYDRNSGVVAAAHDDGRVALYSVRSGCRLPSRDIDRIHSPREHIHCLQFQTLEGDHTPTLFVGDGDSVYTFPFGVDEIDDES